MRNYRLICIAVWILICSGCGEQMTAQEQSAVVDQAEQWLALVDSGNYDASWREAAEYLKGNVAEQKWLQTMTTVRKPLGTLVSRKLKSTRYRTMLPQALKGRYLIIDYQSSFSNKKAAVESITQMMQKDGTWRVAGYHLDEPY